MTKVTLANVTNLLDATTSVNTINSNSSTTVTAFDNTLSRNGSQPNQMGANLDMNSNRIINLPPPISGSEPLRLQDYSTLTTGSLVLSPLPVGGTTNQFLQKNSNANYDAVWKTYNAVVGPQTPEMYGAIGDGVTDDSTALQAWANSIRDGGEGIVSSKLGYATSQTILFQPTTNTAPVQGPKISGNLKLIGIALAGDLLQIFNPTAVSTSQNFYYPSFDSIEVSNTTGTGNGVSVRGFWGNIGKIFGRNVNDVIQFPNFLFGGIPDEYESMCNIGDVTGIDCRGYVINNLIGLGASITCNNVRGTISSFSNPTLGCINCTGSMTATGTIAYTGQGTGLTISYPPSPAIQTNPHEIFMQGWGDIDLGQNGVSIAQASFVRIIGHRLNVEAPNTQGAGPSWPVTAYSIGAVANIGSVIDVYLKPYITIRPGVTSANIGTLFDFHNDIQLDRITVDANISDQTGTNILATLGFSGIFKNISTNATNIKIILNGVIVYDNTNVFTVATLPPASIGLRGVRYTVRDSNIATFGSVVAGGGANVAGVLCNGTNWVVG